ncbi:MAG TPA: hypothetical protein VF590_26315 [Isosphaeraceae bacterium]
MCRDEVGKLFPACSLSPWQAASIELLNVSLEDARGAEEPHEEFSARIDRGLRNAARWLMSRPPGAIDDWRARGRILDIFIGGWLDDE